MAGAITRGKLIRADLANWDGKTATHSRIDASGGTVTGLAFGNEVDVLQVYGSGTSRTRGSIAAAIQQIGSTAVTLVFAPGTWTIDASLTIPSNFTCRIPRGCVFSVDSGQTLTFSGPVIADASAFYSGSGTTTLSVNSIVNGELWIARTSAEISASVTPTNYAYFPEDLRRYGGSGNGSTDNTAVWTTLASFTGPKTVNLYEGTYLTNTATIPDNITLKFSGGKVSVNSGQTLTINGPINAPPVQIFTGAGSINIGRRRNAYAEWWGVVGDDSTDNATALQKAVDSASRGRLNLLFAGGTYRFGANVTLGNNGPFSLGGDTSLTMPSGSDYPHPVFFKWTGGATAAFTQMISVMRYHDFQIENFGTGTRAIDLTRVSGASIASTVRFDSIHSVVPTGASHWSGETIYLENPTYISLNDCQLIGRVPGIRIHAADGTSNFGTWLVVRDSYLKASGAGGTGRGVIEFTEGSGASGIFETVKISSTTIDCFVNAPAIDTTGLSTCEVGNLLLDGFEFSSGQSPEDATQRALKLKNVRNAVVIGSDIIMNGVALYAIDLVESNLSWIASRFGRAATALVNADSNSKVYTYGHKGRTFSVPVLPTSSVAGFVEVPYAAPTVIKGHFADPTKNTVYRVKVTNNTAFTINFRKPAEGDPSYLTSGQLITVMIRNESGGAMGAITWSATHFKMGGAFTNPASAKNRSITFYYDDNDTLVELWRSAADVDN